MRREEEGFELLFFLRSEGRCNDVAMFCSQESSIPVPLPVSHHASPIRSSWTTTTLRFGFETFVRRFACGGRPRGFSLTSCGTSGESGLRDKV